MFPFSTYMYIHIHIHISCGFPLSFLFLKKQTIEIRPQQMSEMYYCKVYFFYNIVYKGIEGDGLPCPGPPGCRAVGGAPDRIHAGQAPINVLGSSLVSASLPCAFSPAWFLAQPHLGCLPGAPGWGGHLSRVLGVGDEAPLGDAYTHGGSGVPLC